jgi:cell division inhibitor SepF
MVAARDAYDDWYEDDEPYAADAPRWTEDVPRGLSLVRRPELAFELVEPEDFEDAQRVADALRDGAPVLVDFHGCDDDLRGRLVDFAAGLVYALGGGLQHVGREVLLLTPDHMDVSGDEASDVRSRGFYNRS